MAVTEFYDPVANRLQVSAGMLGFMCRKSGTGTTGNRSGGNTNTSTILLDTAGMSYPIVALRTDGYAAAMYVQQFNSTVINYASNGAVGSPFTYYIFDWTASLPANNALFQLYNEGTNLCVFSSGYWPMKLVNSVAGGSGGSQNYPRKTMAYACSTVGAHSRCSQPACYDSGNPALDPGDGLASCRNIKGRIDGKAYGASIQDNGSTVQVANVSIDDVLGSFGNYSEYQQYGDGWDVPNQIMSIDVTGIPVGATFF